MRWERSGPPKSKSHLNISVYHLNTLHESLYNFIWFCEDCLAPFILEFSRNTQSWQYWHFCTISNGISWKDLPVNKFKCRFTFVMVHWINSGGSRIFVRGRALWKLHENERIWTPGVRVPGAPLDPPMLKVYKFDQHGIFWYLRNTNMSTLPTLYITGKLDWISYVWRFAIAFAICTLSSVNNWLDPVLK